MGFVFQKMDKLIEKTKALGWSKQPVVLEVEPDVKEKSKLMLLGKVLSSKVFSKTVVKEIILKAWNTRFLKKTSFYFPPNMKGMFEEFGTDALGLSKGSMWSSKSMNQSGL